MWGSGHWQAKWWQERLEGRTTSAAGQQVGHGVLRAEVALRFL